MNAFTAKKVAVLLLVSFLLGMVIIRSHTQNNVPKAIFSGDSQNAEIGDITVRDFGYPLEYRQTQTFKAKESGETELRSVTLGYSIPSIVLNTLFWFALLDLLTRFIRPRTKLTAEPSPETTAV